MTGHPQEPSTVPSENNAAAILGELDQFTRDYRKIRFEFEGEPPFATSTSAWQDAVSRNLILGGDDSDVGFSRAWHEAVSAVRSLMCYRFVPLACRALSTFGTPSLATVPSPPDERNVSVASFEDKVLTADLFEAGKRIVVWSAAHRFPRELNRSSEHSYKFWLWTGTLLEVFPHLIRADVGVAESLDVVIDYLRDSQSGLVEQSLSQPNVGTPVVYRPPSEAEQPLSRKIRCIEKDRFFFEFDGEIGVLHGVGAERFVRLCRHGSVHAGVLARDELSIERSRSVSDESNREVTSIAVDDSEFDKMSSKQRRDLITRVDEELEEIERELAGPLTESRREELESKKEGATNWKNSGRRVPLSDRGKARLAVSRSLRRLAEKCRKDMPTLADAIETIPRFDSRTDEFLIEEMGWEFENFDS